MRIADNVEMLEVDLSQGKKEKVIYPTLTWDDDHLVLFDTGFPGSAQMIVSALANAGFEAKNLTDIILTHQDIDHIGGGLELLALAPQAKVYAHQVDAPFIEGSQTPTKLAQLEARKDQLSPEEIPFYQMLKEGFAHAHLTVNIKLKDDDVLNFAGGIQVVYTPGHTPGHASFYLSASKTLICGDAANVNKNTLVGFEPKMNWDNTLAGQSLDKLKSLDIVGAIAYHTGYLKLS